LHRQTFTVEPGSPIDPTNSSSVANESRTSKSRGLRIARIRAGCAFAVLGRRHPKKAWRLPVQVQNTHELLFGLVCLIDPARVSAFPSIAFALSLSGSVLKTKRGHMTK
jgi:hypothetical protein